MDHSCIFKIMVFFEKFFQILTGERTVIISGIQNRSSAVEFYKILKACAIESVVQYKDPVAGLSQRSAGSFQSQDSLTVQDQRFIVGMKKAAVKIAGLFIIFCKSGILIRILKFSASCRHNIFPYLRRSGGHHIVHGNSS